MVSTVYLENWMTGFRQYASVGLRSVRKNCAMYAETNAACGSAVLRSAAANFSFIYFILFYFFIFIFIFFDWVCIFRSFSDLPNCPVSFMWKTARLYWLCRRSQERPYSTFDDVAHWRCSPSHHHCISGNVCIQLYMGLFQRRGCLNLALLRRKLG